MSSDGARTERRCGENPKREGGSALIVVVLMSLAVTAVLTTILINSNTDHKIAANERDAERALEASKAGINYAYYLYSNGLLDPATSGAPFDSFTSSVATHLDGASFTGNIFDDGGNSYRIVSTGTYNRGSRTTELDFRMVSDALTYGYLAFDQVTIHHHAPGSTPFNVQSTIFSDNAVSVANDMNINGSIVASGSVSLASGDTVQGDVFGYSISNSGTINGKAMFVASVNPTSGTVNVTDNAGVKYAWYSGRSNPGTKAGGTVLGGTSRYVVANGDVFDSNIFAPDGSLIINPPLNVIRYIAPPRLDYAAMKTEADKNDPTFFTTPAAAATYLSGKKVSETIGGVNLTTIKVGTVANPEFIYIRGSLSIELNPSAKTETLGSSAVLKANGLHIEGGIYASGSLSMNGPGFTSPDTNPVGYNEFEINGLPYCFPALISYPEPSSGTIATWTPNDTPAIGKGGDFTMSSSNGAYEGTTLLNGLVYSGDKIHIHHTKADKELVTFNGAEVANTIHNCDYFNFTYDPAVGCTKFLGLGVGTPHLLAFREIR